MCKNLKLHNLSIFAKSSYTQFAVVTIGQQILQNKVGDRELICTRDGWRGGHGWQLKKRKKPQRERDPCINIRAMHNACVHLEFSGPDGDGSVVKSTPYSCRSRLETRVSVAIIETLYLPSTCVRVYSFFHL